MKKLMMAAAIVCAAAFAQAATALWTTSGTFSDINGTAFSEANNVTAYLFDASTLTQAALVESWVGGSTSLADAAVESTWYDAYEQDVTTEIGSSGTKTLYWAVVKGDDLFVSSTITKEIAAVGDTGFSWENNDESGTVLEKQTTFTSAGWYKAAEDPGPEPIPEPTSAMLLLLGVAGLALKRKQK